MVVGLALAACSTKSKDANSPEEVAKQNEARNDAYERMDKSASVVEDFRDKVPAKIADEARCVVVIPSMVKAGLIVGGQSGKGFAVCRAAHAWSAPAPVSISGGSFGAQVGVESVDVLMLVMNDEAKKNLFSSSLKLGANASAAAGPVGADTGTEIKAGVLTYTRNSGLFGGAELSGVSLEHEADTMAVLYGRDATFPTVLSGSIPPPQGRETLNQALQRTFR